MWRVPWEGSEPEHASIINSHCFYSKLNSAINGLDFCLPSLPGDSQRLPLLRIFEILPPVGGREPPWAPPGLEGGMGRREGERYPGANPGGQDQGTQHGWPSCRTRRHMQRLLGRPVCARRQVPTQVARWTLGRSQVSPPSLPPLLSRPQWPGVVQEEMTPSAVSVPSPLASLIFCSVNPYLSHSPIQGHPP